MADILSRLFLRRKSQSPPRPEWALFFTDEQYVLFASLVANYFRGRGQTFEFDGSFVTTPDGRRESHRMGVLNLAQKCAKEDGRNWQLIIDGHFDESARVEGQMAALRARINDFSAVRDLLAVQLYLQEGPVADAIVSREDLPGLLSILVFNLPGATQQVSRVDASAWGKNWDELFEVAIQNVFKNSKPTRNNRVELGDLGAVLVFEGDEFFTATFSLLLTKRKDTIGSAGSFVSLPRNGVLLCHAIGSGNALAAFKVMSVLASEAYRLGPYSLSTQIYWFLDGKFLGVEATGKGKDAVIHGPPELLDFVAGKGPI